MVRVLEPPDGTFAPIPGQPPLEPAPTPSQLAAQSPLAVSAAAAPNPYPLVLVHWLDAWYDADEQTRDDWRDDYAVQTVGYLVRDEGSVVSVAQEVLPDDEGFRAVTHIPRGMVQRIDRLALEPQNTFAQPSETNAVPPSGMNGAAGTTGYNGGAGLNGNGTPNSNGNGSGQPARTGGPPANALPA